MKIKNIYRLCGCLAIALSFSSCGDFLKESSPDLLIPQKVEEYQAVLVGEGYPNHFTDEADFIHLMTDDVEVSPTSDSRSSLWDGDDDYNLRQGKGAFTWAYDIEYYDVSYPSFYKDRYTNIMACTIIIEDADKITGEQEKVNSCVAQAYTLRALNYLWLVSTYAKPYNEQTAASDPGVIIRLKSQVVRDEPVRSTVKEVYDLINSDLDNALERFKNAAVSRNKYLVSERAAQILKSRVALYQGHWDDAIKYADLAAEGGYDLYNIGKMTKSELNYHSGSSASSFAFLDDTNNTEITFLFGGNEFNSNKFMSNILLLKDAMYTPSKTNENDLIHIYEPGDNRLYAFFMQSVDEGGEYSDRHMAPYKHYAFDIYSQAVRTAEALLNAAEAHVQKGTQADVQQAISLLNLLRSNRFAADSFKELTAADFASNEELLTFVRDERRRELCFEDIHRWADLKRYGMPRLVHAFYASKNATPETYVLEEGDQNYILEFPHEVLNYNTKIQPNTRRNLPSLAN